MKKFFVLLLCLSLFVPALAESCVLCGGDAVCDTCNGLGYQEMEAYGGGMVKVACTAGCDNGACTTCKKACAVCGSDGLCDVCGGLGYQEMEAYGGGMTKVACTGGNCDDGKCSACAPMVDPLTQVHTFASSAIKSQVRSAVRKTTGDITYEDLLKVTKLELYNKGVSDLSDLQYMPNLTYVLLSYNEISDITPLSSLVNLTELYLTKNKISDITPLSGLVNLTKLEISDNQISDLKPLKNLTNLTELNLSRNQISDISALSGMAKMEKLYLGMNRISDTAPLSGMRKLTKLYMQENQLSDISPLAKLSNLAEVNLKNNYISSGDFWPVLAVKEIYTEGNTPKATNKPTAKPTATPRPVSRRECPECDGSGKCSECGGDMWVWKTEWVYVNGLPEMKTVNKLCQGRYCYGGSCDKCGGDGWID